MDNYVYDIIKQFVNNASHVSVEYTYTKHFSFRKNKLCGGTITRNGIPVLFVETYYSYNAPVCMVIKSNRGKCVLWWDFVESSTTYRGLYEFLNFTKIAEGKLNRRIIEDLKKSDKSFFVKDLKEDKGEN